MKAALDERELRARTVDALAEWGLSIVAPLVFEVARSTADVDAALRLRYACVVDLGWATPSDFPDGRATDEWDDEATFIVGREHGEIIAALRLVAPRAGKLLPTEHDFDLRLEPREGFIDAGKLVTHPGARTARAHLLLAGLFARSWLTARALGYDRVVSAAAPRLIEFYRGLGMWVTVLGPLRMHWGEQRAPIEIGGGEKSFALMARPGGEAR